MATKAEDNTSTNKVTGNEVRFVNSPSDAPTFYVDGIKGVGIVNDAARIHLTEIFVDAEEADIKGRFALTLVMTPQTMSQISELLARSLKDFAKPNTK